PTSATKISSLKSRKTTQLITAVIRPPNTTSAMTGTAIHFTHHGRPVKISRIASVLRLLVRSGTYGLVRPARCDVLHPMLEPRRGPTGAREPLSSPDPSPREPRDPRSGLGGREDDQNPQILADVVELVGHPGRYVHHAAPRHLRGLHADGDRG